MSLIEAAAVFSIGAVFGAWLMAILAINKDDRR